MRMILANFHLSVNSILVLFGVLFLTLSINCSDPDEHRDIVELIQSRGFAVELHSVTTDDGYILTLHRIVNGNNSIEQTPLKPVIVQHGLTGAAVNFLTNSPFLTSPNSKYGDNLGFSLKMTNRYDVWLSNSRGNQYSMQHKTLSPDHNEFWDFSFHEMAIYDLPATIEYIRKATNSSTVAYIGHSEGTSIMFALLSMMPKYASIVRPFIALAPVVFQLHVKSPIKYLIPISPILKILKGNFFLTTPITNLIGELVCKEPMTPICSNLIFMIGGYDPANLNDTRISVYIHFSPSSTSNKNVLHQVQLITHKRFIRFDYGSESENKAAYGANYKLDYPLEDIPSHAKIAFFRGLNDLLSATEDVEYLKMILRTKANLTLIDDYQIPDASWSHLDYIFGMDARRLYIDHLIELLDQYA